MDSVGKTVGVAFALCVVCSILVSTAAVSLKPIQTKNEALDMKKNILTSAGLLKADSDVEAIYSQMIEEKVISFDTGNFIDMNPSDFNLKKAEANPKTSIRIENDFANLGRRSKETVVYFIKNNSGGYEGVILPIKSQGLWALMYGFIALKNDANTVIGFKYYQQGETPGLGAEVDNPKWIAQWTGKKVFNQEGRPSIQFSKTEIDLSRPEAIHQIDALSGATITTNGVESSLRYWLSAQAYGKFLDQFKNGAL
jgi:Na+-transporting NADH:ubiquinone oxidoreductase subunit C